MSSVRRQLRRLGKKELTPESAGRIAGLKQDWRLLSKGKLKARRKATQDQMWKIQGRKGYWNHINGLRKKKSGIGLKPTHVKEHFRGLLGGKSNHTINNLPNDYYKIMGLPGMEPEPISRDQTEELYQANEDNAILNEIDSNELLTAAISPGEISFALTKLKNSAKGEDQIKILDLQTIPSNDIAEFFAELMFSYKLPTCWHRAILIPIPKKGVPLAPSQLRGIAIQPALRRLFAACIARRLNKWCDLNNILPPMQSGFRPGHRATENIYILRCLMERCHHKKTPLIGVSVDIEKAFHKVNRDLLWRKLENWGARV